MSDQKTCFVVMGFGTKTDFEQQKSFDLDKTYRVIIKPAVEAAGLECIRADDVIHSGVIDKRMYDLLHNADLVIADLSTSNPNAIYELGVRHALRPHTTIVIAESEFKFPYDVKSLLIRPYKHMGEGIDAEEAEQARTALQEAIETLIDEDETDSPVYTFLHHLSPPSSGPAAETAVDDDDADASPAEEQQSFSMMMDMFRQARAVSNWAGAKMALTQLATMRPGDPFIIQQLALATYKGKEPDHLTALNEAKSILSALHPHTSNDPETLGLWGAIHKRLFEEGDDPADLEEAVRSYGKGFNLKDDYYNGINYAFMLNVRAAHSAGDDAIADTVWARRTRERVIELVTGLLAQGVKDDEGNDDPYETFWLRATLIEAYAGSGRTTEAEALKAEAIADAPEDYMPASLNEQLGKLADLMS